MPMFARFYYSRQHCIEIIQVPRINSLRLPMFLSYFLFRLLSSPFSNPFSPKYVCVCVHYTVSLVSLCSLLICNEQSTEHLPVSILFDSFDASMNWAPHSMYRELPKTTCLKYNQFLMPRILDEERNAALDLQVLLQLIMASCSEYDWLHRLCSYTIRETSQNLPRFRSNCPAAWHSSWRFFQTRSDHNYPFQMQR